MAHYLSHPLLMGKPAGDDGMKLTQALGCNSRHNQCPLQGGKSWADIVPVPVLQNFAWCLAGAHD